MPTTEPAEVDAEIRRHAASIVAALLADNPALVEDFWKAFAGDVAAAEEYLTTALASSGEPAAREDEDEDEELTGEELERALRALFEIPDDQPIVIIP